MGQGVTGQGGLGIFGLACLCVLGLAALLAGVASDAVAADPNGDGIPGPPGLPERNYEMVSPPDKKGVNVTEADLSVGSVANAASLGDSLAFGAEGSFADGIPGDVA